MNLSGWCWRYLSHCATNTGRGNTCLGILLQTFCQRKSSVARNAALAPRYTNGSASLRLKIYNRCSTTTLFSRMSSSAKPCAAAIFGRLLSWASGFAATLDWGGEAAHPRDRRMVRPTALTRHLLFGHCLPWLLALCLGTALGGLVLLLSDMETRWVIYSVGFVFLLTVFVTVRDREQLLWAMLVLSLQFNVSIW